MVDFDYTARDVRGQEFVGVLAAESEEAVLRALEESRLFPVSLREREVTRSRGSGGRVRPRDLGPLYGQLGDLLGAGVPLLRALDSLERAAVKPRQRELVRSLHVDVADGQSLTETFESRPGIFPPLHTAMVRAGERASFLEEVLESLSTFIERLDDLRGKVRGALIYPALLVFIGSAVLAAALTFFVPKFEPLLTGVAKPFPTVVVFGASRLLREAWPLLLVGLVLTSFGLVFALQNPGVKRTLERWRFRLPVLGRTLRMVAVTRFCRILGTLLLHGVPLLEALGIAREASGSIVLAEELERAAESVRGGAELSTPLQSSDFFPPQVLAMIAVAEESNRLEKVLLEIAETIERRTHRQVDAAVRLIEPLVLCLVALAIGFLALGLLLPIFTLAGSLGAS